MPCGRWLMGELPILAVVLRCCMLAAAFRLVFGTQQAAIVISSRFRCKGFWDGTIEVRLPFICYLQRRLVDM
ncbi:hypothetical protein LY76DRAFT_360498 [Colletotrichum caudatum]|nr:hypothetical protein LY76DRAFT_360498 [Colletotrichum caudatum]